jgi:hypothetical protein
MTQFQINKHQVKLRKIQKEILQRNLNKKYYMNQINQ